MTTNRPETLYVFSSHIKLAAQTSTLPNTEHTLASHYVSPAPHARFTLPLSDCAVTLLHADSARRDHQRPYTSPPHLYQTLCQAGCPYQRPSHTCGDARIEPLTASLGMRGQRPCRARDRSRAPPATTSGRVAARACTYVSDHASRAQRGPLAQP